MAPSTDDVALSDGVNGLPSFRRAWSSVIAIASPNNEVFPSSPSRYSTSSRPFNLLRASATTKCSHSSPAFPCEFLVRLFEDEEFFGFFSWCMLGESVKECEEVGVEIIFFFSSCYFIAVAWLQASGVNERRRIEFYEFGVKRRGLGTDGAAVEGGLVHRSSGSRSLKFLSELQISNYLVVAFLTSSRNRVLCQWN